MTKECTLQVFIDGVWRDAAALTLMGDQLRGVKAQTFLSYEGSYALGNLTMAGHRNGRA